MTMEEGDIDAEYEEKISEVRSEGKDAYQEIITAFRRLKGVQRSQAGTFCTAAVERNARGKERVDQLVQDVSHGLREEADLGREAFIEHAMGQLKLGREALFEGFGRLLAVCEVFNLIVHSSKTPPTEDGTFRLFVDNYDPALCQINDVMVFVEQVVHSFEESAEQPMPDDRTILEMIQDGVERIDEEGFAYAPELDL